MKHTYKVTLLLLLFYVAAQVIGLFLINQQMNVQIVDGVISAQYGETALGERPQLSGSEAFLYLVFGVGIGTGLLLLIIRHKKMNLWKIWFFLASCFAMALALGAVIQKTIAYAISIILAWFKVFRPNVTLHNLTEILMYSGIAVFFVPMLELKWAIILLIAFSVYDAYAVWKSKHMIKMAEFQSDSRLFAGLNVPYKKISKPAKTKTTKKVKEEFKTAILGGGDIALPLLFTGAVMQWLVANGVNKLSALGLSMIIVVTSAISLFLLFYLAEKDKFYPAMPFISAGCFLGLGILALL